MKDKQAKPGARVRGAVRAAAAALRQAWRGLRGRQDSRVLCPAPVPVVVRRRAR